MLGISMGFMVYLCYSVLGISLDNEPGRLETAVGILLNQNGPTTSILGQPGIF